MKTITELTIESIIKDKGATINSKGELVTFKTGYQVSKRDLIKLPVKDLTTSIIVNNLRCLSSNNEYLGLWVDDGFVYVDISCRIANKKDAMAMGRCLNQISILRWSDMQCLSVR